MSLFDHGAEAELIRILADVSQLDVDRAKSVLARSNLVAADFSLPHCAEAFAAASGLLHDRKPVDLIAMTAALAGNPLFSGKKGGEKLAHLVAGDGRTTEVAFPGHAQLVKELALKRRALQHVKALEAELQRPGSQIAEVLSGGAKGWAGLSLATSKGRNGAEVFMEYLTELELATSGQKTLTIPTGIDVWDQVLGGLECGKLTFIGSQPGVGKSALLATMLENLSRAGVRTALFSLEDLGTWLPQRWMSLRAAVPLFVLAKKADTLGKHQQERISEASAGIFDAMKHIHMDDRSMLTPEQVELSARDYILNHGAKVIFVDHLGKMDFKFRGATRPDLLIEDGLNRLTAVAKEHKVAVVIACHMTREKGKHIRPDATDFAQTAFIERDARNAVGLYLDKDNDEVLNVATLKQTNGAADIDFPLRRFKAAGMVSSKNGRLEGQNYEQDEMQLLRERQTG